MRLKLDLMISNKWRGIYNSNNILNIMLCKDCRAPNIWFGFPLLFVLYFS
jgi:hypothetical protein